MFWQSKHRVLFKALCVVTLIGFSPSAVAAWHYMPLIQTTVMAQAEPGVDNYREGVTNRVRVSAKSPTATERALARLLDDEELSRAASVAIVDRAPDVDRIDLDSILKEPDGPTPNQIQLAQSSPPPSGPGADLLAAGDAALAANDQGTAGLTYLQVLDQYPNSAECKLANLKLTELEQSFARGEIPQEEINQFMNGLPSFEECSSAEAKYTLMNFAYARGRQVRDASGAEVAKPIFEGCRDMAWSMIQEHPNEAITYDAVTLYYEAGEFISIGEAHAASKNLHNYIKTSSPSVARWAARLLIINHKLREEADPGVAMLMASATIAEANKGITDHCFENENTYDWLKALIKYQLAIAHHHLNENQEALLLINDIMEDYPDTGWPSYLAGYSQAFLIDTLNPDVPNTCVAAYQTYIDEYPDSPFAGRALMAMANVYQRSGDYEYAAQLCGEVIENYPNTGDARDAFSVLEYIERHGYITEQLIAEGRDPELEETEVAQNCGPYTLQRVLAAQGVNTTVDELATAAGTDDTGTTMAGLVAAAEHHGISLLGVAADDPTVLPHPFIAFVNNNHFVLVNETTVDKVVYEDIAQPRSEVSRLVFDRMWDGKALVLGNAQGLDTLLNMEELKGAKGGLVGGGGEAPATGQPAQCPNGLQPPPPPPSCPISDSAKSSSSTKPGSLPQTGDAVMGGPTIFAGDHGMSSITTGINTDAVNVAIVGYQAAQQVQETDISFKSKGGMKVVFSRNFFNEWGYGRYRYRDSTTSSMENVIGFSWTHNYHMQLEESDVLIDSMVDSEEPPESVLFRDYIGNMMLFEYVETTGGVTYYEPQTDAMPHFYGYTVQRNATNDDYSVHLPDGSILNFSTASALTDSLGWCRLESIENEAGTTIDLEYDHATIGFGKLTKVSTPSGDDRYLEFSYDTTNGMHLITKVAFKDSTTEIKSVTYSYEIDANEEIGELTKVDYGSLEDVWYTYASDDHPDQTNHPNEKVGRYISKITDKADVEYDFTMDYQEHSSGNVSNYGVNLTLPNGVDIDYDREMVTGSGHSDTTVIVADGVTDLKKVHYDMGRHGVFLDEIKFYDTPGGTTGDSWLYSYDTNDMNFMTKVTDAYVTRDYRYKYSDYGIMTESKSGGDDWIAHSYSTDAFYPDSSDAGGVTTNYYYDAATTDPQAKLTKVTHPSYASTGYLYSYDSDGQLTKVTDPDSNDTTYAYDAYGNITSTTNALTQTTTYAYDDFGNMTTATTPGSDTMTYYFSTSCGCSQSGRLTKVKDPGNNETEYFYDSKGNMTKVTDALDNDILLYYDDNNLVTKRLEDTDKSFFFYRNKLGLITKTTDDESKDITYEFNDRGWMTKATDPIDYVTYDYAFDGQQTLVTDGLGQETEYFYDTAGRLTRTEDHDGNEIEYYFDSDGRSTKRTSGLSLDPTTVLYHYSATTAQMTKIDYYYTSVDKNTATYNYDSTTGYLTKVTDWIDATDGLRYAYDDLGRLTQITDYDDSTLTYYYNSSGELTKMNDYHSNDTTYTYYNTGRLSTITAPGSKTWTYYYNALGQPTKQSNPNGTDSTWTYDARNRLTKIGLLDGVTTIDETVYGLDDSGNITSATDESGEEWTYEYDGRYRLTSATLETSTNVEGVWNYTYDDGGNMLTKETPYMDDFNDGNTTGWTAAAGTWSASSYYLEDTGAGTNPLLWKNDFTDDDHEMRFRIQRTNSTAYTMVYVRYTNSSNWVKVEFSGTNSGLRENVSGSATYLDTNTAGAMTEDVWYNVRVVADGDNVKVWIAEDGEMPELIFDETVDATNESSSKIGFHNTTGSTVEYDDIWLYGTSLSNTYTYAYNSANELTTVTNPNGGSNTSFTYDSLGRPTQKTQGSWTADYDYRYDQSLYSVDTDFPGEDDVTYEYNSRMMRIQSSVNSSTTKFRWSIDSELVSLDDDNDDLTRTYPVARGVSLAHIDGSNPSTGEFNYYWRDHSGSKKLITNQSKGVIGENLVFPVGGALSFGAAAGAEDESQDDGIPVPPDMSYPACIPPRPDVGWRYTCVRLGFPKRETIEPKYIIPDPDPGAPVFKKDGRCYTTVTGMLIYKNALVQEWECTPSVTQRIVYGAESFKMKTECGTKVTIIRFPIDIPVPCPEDTSQLPQAPSPPKTPLPNPDPIQCQCGVENCFPF